LVSKWEGIKKPDIHIIKRALAMLNASPQEIIFIGDHLEHDVIVVENPGIMQFRKEAIERKI